MAPWKYLLVLSHFLLTILCLAAAQSDFLKHFCVDHGNYSNGSTYQTNLNTLLPSIPSNIDEYGFYNSTIGWDPDRVYAVVLCRGDVDLATCRSCVSDSVSTLTGLCPGYKEAVVWYDFCMLRYSNRSFAGWLQHNQTFFMWNENNATSVDRFNEAVQSLLTDLRSKAAAGGRFRKFAAANTTGPNFQTIFALVQCTPDLSEQSCNECLIWAIDLIPDFFDGKTGGRVVSPSCNLRFEVTPISKMAVQSLSPPAPVESPQPPWTESPTPPSGNNSNRTRTVIVVVVSISSVAVLILISVCFWLIFSRRGKQKKPIIHKVICTMDDQMSTVETLQYDFDTIQAATDDFSDANRLGQGGFGAVYKGTLPSAQEIAVKRLSARSGQGEVEFKNEVVVVAKLQHRNLVRLLGFCLEGEEKILVYEYVPNRSLDHFLFDPKQPEKLDWPRRYKIIGGIARGLLYLHEDSRLKIIHRDLKASNVLLDADMNAKISDFGMAKIFGVDQTQGSTNRIVGTYGYMSPEYALHGSFSVKLDVFSFGILIIEMISGKKRTSFYRSDSDDLLSYAWQLWTEGRALELMDEVLAGSFSEPEIVRCMHIGLLCVQDHAADRPTMSDVVLMLNSERDGPQPKRPDFSFQSLLDSDLRSQGKDDICSVNKATLSAIEGR